MPPVQFPTSQAPELPIAVHTARLRLADLQLSARSQSQGDAGVGSELHILPHPACSLLRCSPSATLMRVAGSMFSKRGCRICPGSASEHGLQGRRRCCTVTVTIGQPLRTGTGIYKQITDSWNLSNLKTCVQISLVDGIVRNPHQHFLDNQVFDY